MTDLRKAAEMALEALDELESCARGDEPFNHFAAPLIRQFIEKALAQPEQESVGACVTCGAPKSEWLVDAVNMSQERVDETAKGEQEPVGWMYTLNDQVGEVASTVSIKRFDLSVTSPYGRQGIDYAQVMTVKEFPLYTAPPKRGWVGLTDEEARKFYENYTDREELIYAIDKFLKEKNGVDKDEELHLQAAGYANRRKEAYIKCMKTGDCPKRTKDQLNAIWLAHYEGYREGFWVKTGDTRFSTNPDKNHGAI